MAFTLGIDVSTTASKAILLSDDGTVVATRSTAHQLSTPRPLWSEQDPEMWWSATLASVQQVVREANVPASAIKGVGLTGQMHGLVLLDAAGEVIRPAILWDDQRSAAECDAIRERFGLMALVALTGNDAFPGFTLPKLLWVRNHEPDLYARVEHVLLPKDYVRYRLTGAFATDKAGAGGTLMLNLENRAWSSEICDAFDIPMTWLPPTFEGTEVTSSVSSGVAGALGILADTPIVAGAGDQAAQAVGVGAIDPGVVAITLGTSGVVFAGSDRPLVDPDGRAHAFPHAVPDRWHMMGVMLSAAGSLRWYHDTLAQSMDYESLLSEAATAAVGCDGLTFMPYLSGERTPHADPYVRGAFVGLTLAHGREHLTRSVLEGVTFGLKDNLDLLVTAGLEPPEVIRISGGGAQSDFWLQMIADVLETTMVTLESSEGAALGAAMLAGVGVGFWSDANRAADACVRLTGTVEPAKNGQVYRAPLARFRELYSVLGPSYRPSL